ncbi:hypothetical protein [Pseudorhodoplanes sp.]|uniref:hypothetical protein n=1 Tax=Pseudorhodoplanes sp. TaxID=1934341 RepID=UPI002B772273|nr:hypothetical protein [Pseudorhodoplanes sp.]HWV54343.1 hypothetical protein [Pseudorhodoplanes sp.]
MAHGEASDNATRSVHRIMQVQHDRTTVTFAVQHAKPRLGFVVIRPGDTKEPGMIFAIVLAATIIGALLMMMTGSFGCP